MFIRIAFFILTLVKFSNSDFMFDASMPNARPDVKETLNTTLSSGSGGPYTYSQTGHHFYGVSYDGSYIDTYGCCSGQSGSCRNNPSCQCQVSVGPLPQGTYTLGNMMTFKGMSYCYELYPASTNSMCGRSGFLIHGGSCSGNPSEGCIVIENESTRYKIKSGATIKVVG